MLVLQQQFPTWRELRIHESSPGRKRSKSASRKGVRGIRAEPPFPNKPPGSVVEGFRCEDLECLTFPDTSIDLHVSQDVLEHVQRPETAFAEIARTLRPGGAHVFTVPIVNKDRPSRMRIGISDSGEISYVETPEYHMSPIDPKGTS